MSVANRRIDARPLVEEYHRRPWRDSLAIVLDDAEERRRAEELCERIAGRSAMKRLLVFEGTGMALDDVRAARIEIGAISRLPHAVALKQTQATGVDRFLTVLSATPEGEAWAVGTRAAECLSYFGREAEGCVFVGAEAGTWRRRGGWGWWGCGRGGRRRRRGTAAGSWRGRRRRRRCCCGGSGRSGYRLRRTGARLHSPSQHNGVHGGYQDRNQRLRTDRQAGLQGDQRATRRHARGGRDQRPGRRRDEREPAEVRQQLRSLGPATCVRRRTGSPSTGGS